MLKMITTSPLRLGVGAVSVTVNITSGVVFAPAPERVPVMVPSEFSVNPAGNGSGL